MTELERIILDNIEELKSVSCKSCDGCFKCPFNKVKIGDGDLCDIIMKLNDGRKAK